ncbi:MAG: response regulator [Bacteroidales bacterium]|nr:response regulator [Bacteroidales bacterium]
MTRKKAPSTKKNIILIVDDDNTNLQVIGSFLYNKNYKIILAKNGNDALKSVENNHPDLILLDIMMPGMNGYEVCEKLKDNNQTKDIPIMFLTAKTETKDIIKGFKTGGVDYITKPFIKEELLARIQTHISLKMSQDLLKEQTKKLEKANKIILDSVKKFGQVFRTL